MLVLLSAKKPWTYKPPGEQTHIIFASASSRSGSRLDVFLNDELVERVFLSSPHSWWSATNQPICRTPLLPKDTLRLELDEGEAAIRFDIEEF